MTNNIEKMYELAGIEKRFKAYTEDGRVKYFHTLDEIIKSNIYYRPDMYCRDLDDVKEYPPFTESKQLELIKWLAIKHSKYSILHIDKYCNYFRVSFDKDKTKDDIGYEFDYAGHNTDFPQALAGLVCELWEDLTPEQREEVRGILR